MNDGRKDVLGAFDAIVLGQTRVIEIERLCLECSTVLPTERVGVGTGRELVSHILITTTVINGVPVTSESGGNDIGLS